MPVHRMRQYFIPTERAVVKKFLCQDIFCKVVSRDDEQRKVSIITNTLILEHP